MKSFIRILKFANKYYGLALLNIAFNILSVIFSLFSLIMIIPFLELIFERQKMVFMAPIFPDTATIASLKAYFISLFYYKISGIIILYGSVSALFFICCIVVCIFFLKNLFRYLAMFALAPLRNGVVRDIRNSLYEKVLILPLAYFSEQRKGDIIARMSTDVQDIEWSIMSVLETVFREPITILLSLTAMTLISPQLTLFVLVLLPITGLIIGRIGKSLKQESAKAQEKLGVILSIIDESLHGLRIIKAFSGKKYQQLKFGKENYHLSNIMTRMLQRRDLSSPLSEFLGISVVVTVLWFGGKLVLNPSSTLEAETFIAFLLIFSQLIPPAKSFTTAFYHIQKGIASVERIEQILEAKVTITEKKEPVPLKEFKHSIEYKNVSFKYDKEYVLDDVNIKINKGVMIALVGQSGAGKTTLADLLPRFYDVESGEILIDGINIKDISLNDLRALMGVVTQESILFNDTIFNNISYGLENANEKEIIKAAKISNAHGFIMQMEHGYHTVIGDRGLKLSGGERQRLSIARAILKNPPILILDEATSSLDSESEKLVQEAIFKLMQNRTSVVIAHRLSTIQYADEIIVLQDGKINERGNHIGLMAKNGIYRKLVDLQAF